MSIFIGCCISTIENIEKHLVIIFNFQRVIYISVIKSQIIWRVCKNQLWSNTFWNHFF